MLRKKMHLYKWGCGLGVVLVWLGLIGCAPSQPSASPQIQYQTFRYSFKAARGDLDNLHAGDTLTIPIEAEPAASTTHAAVPVTLTVRFIGPFVTNSKTAMSDTVEGKPPPAAMATVVVTNQTPSVPPLRLALPKELKPGFYATVWETAEGCCSMTATGTVEIQE